MEFGARGAEVAAQHLQGRGVDVFDRLADEGEVARAEGDGDRAAVGDAFGADFAGGGAADDGNIRELQRQRRREIRGAEFRREKDEHRRIGKIRQLPA